MAEVEIAGAKIKGGKILLILPILGTLVVDCGVVLNSIKIT